MLVVLELLFALSTLVVFPIVPCCRRVCCWRRGRCVARGDFFALALVGGTGLGDGRGERADILVVRRKELETFEKVLCAGKVRWRSCRACTRTVVSEIRGVKLQQLRRTWRRQIEVGDVRNGGGASDGVHVVVLGVVRGMVVVDVHSGDSEEEDGEEAGRGKLTPRTTQQCAKFKLRTVGFTAC